MRKQLAPGDLVFSWRGGVTKPHIDSGIIIEVMYARTGPHMGCDKRLRVFWSQMMRITEECDCKVIVESTFGERIPMLDYSPPLNKPL